MTAKEMIWKYEIKPQTVLTDHGFELTGKIITYYDMNKQERQELVDKADEIKEILFAEWHEKKKAEAERIAKINAIEGLKEIQDAEQAVEEWEYKFSKSFEGEDAVGGMGVGEYPKVDIDALKAKYPRAAAYLKADDMALKTNFMMSNIGLNARERIINEPDNYEEIIKEMDSELDAELKKAIWD